LLAQHGIFYPSFTFRERIRVNHSDLITGAIGSAPGLYGMTVRLHVDEGLGKVRQELTRQFDEILDKPQGDTLLLSAELVCDYLDRDLKKLRSVLQKRTRELKVIAFVRSPQSSLESILQQRLMAGNIVDPRSLVGVVTQRYTRLKKVFADQLEFHNFHEAVQHPAGIVGYFLSSLGLPPDQLADLDFDKANPRISSEAHTLIEAINRAFPANNAESHGVERSHMDIKALTSLPGQPFRISAFRDSGLYDAVTREGELLERQLGWQFPQIVPSAIEPLWQTPTLMALEDAVSRLGNKAFRDVVSQALAAEADDLESADPATATILRFIIRRINALDDLPVQFLLDQLGADYFKFSALQVDRECPEMALQLMSLARHLRPEAEFINERVRHYRGKLEKSRDRR
jgi:hypothetical protein